MYNFGKCKLATASFGHGVATTILQLAKGYAILSNGGYDIKPTLVENNLEKNTKKKKLLNKGVSEQVVNALRKIVSTEEGTAKLADVEFLSVVARLVLESRRGSKRVTFAGGIFEGQGRKVFVCGLGVGALAGSFGGSRAQCAGTRVFSRNGKAFEAKFSWCGGNGRAMAET